MEIEFQSLESVSREYLDNVTLFFGGRPPYKNDRGAPRTLQGLKMQSCYLVWYSASKVNGGSCCGTCQGIEPKKYDLR